MDRRTTGMLAGFSLLFVVFRLMLGHVPGITHIGFGQPMLTGIGLLILLGMMMMMPLTRIRGKIATRKRVQKHATIGIAGPLLLAVHASSFGYGYEWVLCFLFLSSFGSGVAMTIWASKSGAGRRGQQAWHTLLATALLVLVGAHVWIAIYYE